MSWSSDVCIYIKIFLILVGNGKLKGGKELPKQNFTRKLLLLEDKMKKTKKQIQKHRKRIQRLTNNNSSPRSKGNKLVRHLSATSLKKIMLFHTAVVEKVRAKYAKSRGRVTNK